MNEPQYLTLEKFDSTMAVSEARFESAMLSIDNSFGEVISTMNSRFDRHEEVIESLVTGQRLLLEETRDIKHRVIHLEEAVDDIQYSVSNLTRVEEKNAEATINHENRLKRLEKINNIQANSPSHLIDIY